MAKKHWCVLASACIAAVGSLAWAQQDPETHGAQLLAAGRNAYNNNDYNAASDRFREFIKLTPAHRNVAEAYYGLGLSAFYTNDTKAALDAFAAAAKSETFAQRGSALYYHGLTLRLRASQLGDELRQKPDQAATLRPQVTRALDEAAVQFAAAAKADESLAPRARVELADTLLRANKPKDALAALDPVLADKTSTNRPAALFIAGQAHLALKDYTAAGRALSALAPFNNDFGLHARYLLARVHHLSGERPEAAALYQAVLTDFTDRRKAAEEELRKNPAFERRAYLESLRAGERGPEFVQRAAFYLGSLQGELGQLTEAIARLRPMAERDASLPLTREAQLRIGQLYLQSKNYEEANRWLEQARQDKALADQALWLTARLQLARADAGNPQSVEQAQRAAIDTLRTAAKAAAEITKTDPDASTRRLEISLECGHLLMATKQYKEAATHFSVIATEFGTVESATIPLQEVRERLVTAHFLAGQLDQGRQAAATFERLYPNSPLLSSVLYRQAEASYLAAVAEAAKSANAAPLFAQAVTQFQRVSKDFPESPFAQFARLGVGMSLYRQEKFAEAAETLAKIPEGERLGDLSLAHYLQGDALLRTLPPVGDDALTAAKFLQQTDAVSRLLSSYASLSDKAPTAPDAMLKYGYIQQRVASLILDPAERRRNLQAARETYDKVMVITKEGPVFAAAVFEKGKTLALIGDVNNATAELRRFTQDPLRQSHVAPLAIVRLGSLLRAVNKAQEAADTLKAARDAYEATLLKDNARRSWAAMLQYEHASALREAAKLPEARELFEQIATNFAGSAEGQNALWRAAQCRREELALAVLEAQKVMRAAGKPEEAEAARKIIDEAPQKTLAAARSLEDLSTQFAKSAPASEAHLRVLYELAWNYRTLGDAQLEAARIKIRREALERLRTLAQQHPNDVAAGASANLATAEPSLDRIPLQPQEKQAIDAYNRLIKAGGEQPLVQLARIELGELLAVRGQYDEALAVLASVLDGQAPPPLIDRARVRLAAALIGQGHLDRALAQTILITRPNSPAFAEARFLGGEAYFRKQDWAKTTEVLSPFRDQPQLRGSGEIAERALLRLGQAFAEQNKFEESRQAYELQLQRFPNGMLANDARYGMAYALQKMNRHDEAAQVYGEITKRTAAEVAARAMLQTGRVRFEQKRYADAVKAYAAVAYTYDYPELSAAAWYESGKAYAELKQAEDEMRALERLLNDYPKSALAAAAAKRLSEIKK